MNESCEKIIDFSLEKEKRYQRDIVPNVFDSKKELNSDDMEAVFHTCEAFMKLLQDYKDIVPNVEKHISATAEDTNSNNKEINEHIIKCKTFEDEVEVLKMKLSSSLPIHSIVYMCTTAMAFTVFVTILFIELFKGIRLIHPYICVSGIIGSAGLFGTALLSLKDWKEFLNER